MKALFAVGLLAVLAAIVVVGGGGSAPVHADHEDPVTPPVPVVTRAWLPDKLGGVVEAPPNADGFQEGIPAIAGNLVSMGRGTGP